MESQFFIYDNIKSSDMDLHIMRIDHSGFIETPYWGGMDIKEDGLNNKLTPYEYGVELQPIEFTIQVVLTDKYLQPEEWTPQKRYDVAKWIIGDRGKYKPFQTSDDLGKTYYAKCISEGNLNLMFTKGYAELTFRTNSPYAWSPIYIDEHNLLDNNTSKIIQLESKSNVLKMHKPKLEIEYPDMVGFPETTDIILRNLSDGGREFKLTDVKKGEIYSFDNENKIIKSSRQTNLNPLTHFNRNWLELVYGVNQVEVEGKIKLWIKSQFPIAQ